MLLAAKELLERKNEALLEARQKLDLEPGLALIWVGEDPQTAAFIRAKQRKAQDLNCEFFLHHFPQAETRQLEALILGLNKRKDIHGIVLQLPLPPNVDRELLIKAIDPIKDIDNLQGGSLYSAPTAQGIIDLLLTNQINPGEKKTIILGDGLLVGHPLSQIFRKNNWPFTQINNNAQNQAGEIKKADLLIACTGQANLVTPSMVNEEMIVVDGSGVDVDVKTIEPFVKIITPPKGGIGPLTVTNLFSNLLSAVK